MTTPYGKRRHPDGYWVVDPMPSAEELQQYYDTAYFNDSGATATFRVVYDEEELRHKRLQAELVLQCAARGWPASGAPRKLLDIGCGEGFQMAVAQAQGWKVRGIDFTLAGVQAHNPDLAPYAEQADVFEVLRSAAIVEKFDLCSLVNVVEHLRDPVDVLQQVKSLLNPGGRVAVLVPNDDSLLQRLAREKGLVEGEPWFAPPDHLNYFNTDNLAKFAGSCGYDMIDLVGTFPIDLYLFHPGSNYVGDAVRGKQAHRARISLELAIADRSRDAYYDFCRAMAAAGIGRGLLAILQPRG
jgi:2-polyprenyl-3-methyl-5-hydroxy-6-metoxy-1,4-benzoquinol methylase